MARRDGKIFHVKENEAGETLAGYLRARMAGRSWGEVKDLVRGRRVTVNGNLCQDGARRVKAREVVKVLAEAASPPPSGDNLLIRYLDGHLVIVEKPAGVTSNRHAEERLWSSKRRGIQPTLDELLPTAIALASGKSPDRERQQASSRRPRPGGKRASGALPKVFPVHRLDRDTSGLMVFARTPQARDRLIEQFRRHRARRRYLAIVHGDLTEQTIETYLARDRGDGIRGSVAGSGGGVQAGAKRAVTHARPLERLGQYTLVECVLETGRTHQIRIHLSERGHPVCGDKIYGGTRGKPRKEASGAPRLALHSTELAIEHPATGDTLKFEMALPKDLARFWKRLRDQVPSSRSPPSPDSEKG